MAVKIPQYEDRLTPSGFGVVPHANGVQFTDAVGQSMQAFGDQGQRYTGVQMHLLQQKNEADAITDAGKKLSDANVEWNKWIQDKQLKAPPGAPDFYGEVDTHFNDWRKQTLDTITDPKARTYAERIVNGMRDNILGGALQFQAKAGVSKRLNDLEDTTRNYESEVGKDLNQYQFARAAVLGVIANDPTMDANTKATMARTVADRLTNAAVNGAIVRDSTQVRDAILDKLGKTALTEDEENQIRSTGATTSTVQTASTDQVWSALIGQESNGKQLKADGTPLTSKKGAIGIAQVMPGTAPYAAKLAGLPWDEKKYKTDATYNEALGKAYFSKQMETFNGDVTKALAAYNMGPGEAEKQNGVRGLIMKYGDQWLSHAPKETQDYVAAISKKVGGLTQSTTASGDKSLPTQTSTAKREFDPALMEALDQLPQNHLIPMLHAATAEVNRQQTVMQGELKTTESDHMSAAANGERVANPIPLGRYITAFGEKEGAQRYENYTKVLQLGDDIGQLKTLPVDQQQAFLDARKPDPTKPGYALAVQRDTMLRTALDNVNKQRAEDPMAWASANRMGDVKALNFNDTNAFGAELAKRVGVSSTMTSKFGTAPLLLTKAEQQTLTTGFKSMTTEQQLSYLNTIRGSVKDPAAYRSIMQQIAPDSPIMAAVGSLMGQTYTNQVGDKVYRPDQVAGIILEGEALLNPNKAQKASDGKARTFSLPEDKKMHEAFATSMGTAFSGNAAREDLTYQAVKNYYAGKSAREGDFTGVMNDDRMKESINAVTGGGTDVNGKGKVLRPWGMSETYFVDQAQKKFKEQIKANGYTESMFDQWGVYGLQSFNDNEGKGRDLYLVRSGTGYLPGRDGKPIVLDMTLAPSLMHLVPKSNAQDAAQAAQNTLPPVNPQPEKTDKLTNTKPKTK